MAPIGSVIRNSLVYMVIMGIATFITVTQFLFDAFVGISQYAADTNDQEAGNIGLNGLFFGTLILIFAHGIATNLTLPSVVGDEMIEF